MASTEEEMKNSLEKPLIPSFDWENCPPKFYDIFRETLQLQATHLDLNALLALRERLTDTDVPCIISFLNAHPTITSLDITSNVITAIGAIDLANIRTLRILKIAHNPIGDVGVLALTRNQNLKDLDVSGTGISHPNTIYVLAANKNLEALNISSTLCINAIAIRAFAANTTLKKLTLSHCDLHNFISIISTNNTLEWLNIQNNKRISADSIQKLMTKHQDAETFQAGKQAFLMGKYGTTSSIRHITSNDLFRLIFGFVQSKFRFKLISDIMPKFSPKTQPTVPSYSRCTNNAIEYNSMQETKESSERKITKEQAVCDTVYAAMESTQLQKAQSKSIMAFNGVHTSPADLSMPNGNRVLFSFRGDSLAAPSAHASPSSTSVPTVQEEEIAEQDKEKTNHGSSKKLKLNFDSLKK